MTPNTATASTFVIFYLEGNVGIFCFVGLLIKDAWSWATCACTLIVRAYSTTTRLATITIQASFSIANLYAQVLCSHTKAVSKFSNAPKTRHLGTLYYTNIVEQQYFFSHPPFPENMCMIVKLQAIQGRSMVTNLWVVAHFDNFLEAVLRVDRARILRQGHCPPLSHAPIPNLLQRPPDL